MEWENCSSSRMEIHDREVHLWRADLREKRGSLEAMAKVLSDEELASSRRFRFGRDAELFILSHGALREILSLYLGVEPKRIPIVTAAGGRPELGESLHMQVPGRIRFNLSHSGTMAAIAVMLDCNIGVDIEYMDPGFPAMEAAKHVLTEDELDLLQSCQEEKRTETFYRLWTRREALLKAIGAGLSGCGYGSGKPEAIPFPKEEASFGFHEEGGWTFWGMESDGHCISVAAEGSGLHLRLFRW